MAFAVSMALARVPAGVAEKSQFLRPSANGLIAFSTRLLCAPCQAPAPRVDREGKRWMSPILEADFFGLQYGFRPGTDAKAAVRKVHWCVTKERKTEIVDADLKDYFTSIPHGQLFRSLSRRVADGTFLAVIKA